MSDQKDAVRLLNQRFPIWKFLGKKEFWEEASTSPVIYFSFVILLFGSIGFVTILSGLSDSGAVLSPSLVALAALLGLTAYIGSTTAFGILRVQQLKKQQEINQRALEHKE